MQTNKLYSKNSPAYFWRAEQQIVSYPKFFVPCRCLCGFGPFSYAGAI